MIMNITISK